MLTLYNVRRLGLPPLSFRLEKGECMAVQGPSGAGKSLLLRAIADLDPSEGEIRLNGQSRHAIPAPSWRRQVVYVPAESGWWSDEVSTHFPVWEAAAPWIEAFRLPVTIRERTVQRLSTGERQRLALIRALSLHPCVLLLDEPTSGLDSQTTGAVEHVLKERLKKGNSMLWVTHDSAQARRVARRCLFLEKDRVQEARL